MKPRLALRISIVAFWVSILLGVPVSIALEADLPVLLQDYLSWDLEQELARTEYALLIIGVVLVAVNFLGSIGLFWFRGWGRGVFVLSTVALLVVAPFTGPNVEHGYAMVFSSLESFSKGFVFCIVFFTDAVKGAPSEA